MIKNNNLKIAMFGHKRIPSREGGVEVVVEELCTRLVNKGYDVVCYNRRGHHVSGKEFDSQDTNIYKGIKLKTVFTINKRGLAAISSSFFASLKVLFDDSDIVHIHAEGPAAMTWLIKLRRKHVVVTIHGLDWQRSKWGGFATWYLKHGEKQAVKHADEVIVLSKNVQEYFKEIYNRETVYIPNGITKPRIKDAKMIFEEYGLKKDEYILFLGRLVPEKGIRYLIRAFMNTKTKKALVIAGGTSDTDEFQAEMKQLAEKDERILFTGFVQGIMLEELYSNAYIYTLPSDVEGMPLSLLEAMSYGNCCLVSNISECVEVVDKFGVSFTAGDEQALQEKLQWLCDNPSLVNEYKCVVADYVCNKYSWDESVDKLITLYLNNGVAV